MTDQEFISLLKLYAAIKDEPKGAFDFVKDRLRQILLTSAKDYSDETP